MKRPPPPSSFLSLRAKNNQLFQDCHTLFQPWWQVSRKVSCPAWRQLPFVSSGGRWEESRKRGRGQSHSPRAHVGRIWRMAMSWPCPAPCSLTNDALMKWFRLRRGVWIFGFSFALTPPPPPHPHPLSPGKLSLTSVWGRPTPWHPPSLKPVSCLLLYANVFLVIAAALLLLLLPRLLLLLLFFGFIEKHAK